MFVFDPQSYGPELAPLLAGAPVNELGPGKPNASMRAALTAVCSNDREISAACCAGLWLRHDFLDQSHSISQSLQTPEGSYWHAIMHRREPDFANSKYWFRRVGTHAIFGPLNAAAQKLSREAKLGREAAALAEQTEWDPMRFVDLCEIALDGPSPIGTLCMSIQLCEWELLFDHCFRQARGS